MDDEKCDRGEIRFVFLGHVKASKGIHLIVDAARAIGKYKFLVDIYGPLYEGLSELQLNHGRVRYRGILEPECVLSTLVNYDVLLLPSHWIGEGYPGVILEAFNAGLAVIATEWGGIPELVSDDVGVLVPIKDSKSLAEAMLMLIRNQLLLNRMKKNARIRATTFDSEEWVTHFIELHQRLAAGTFE